MSRECLPFVKNVLMHATVAVNEKSSVCAPSLLLNISHLQLTNSIRIGSGERPCNNCVVMQPLLSDFF
jgi:hypothetical protein